MPESIFKRMGATISAKIDAMQASLQTNLDEARATLQADLAAAKLELQTNIDTSVASATTNQYHNTPYDIATAVVNKPSGNAKILKFVAPRVFTIPTNALGSLFRAGTVSISSPTFTIYKNDTQIGTLVFSAGVANGVCTLAQTVFTAGDVLSIIAPPVQDNKLADIMITISARL